MRINEINGVNEGILDKARQGARRLRNKFSKSQNTQNSSPQVEPTMEPEAEPQFAAWRNARNPGAPAATSPQAAAPQPATYDQPTPANTQTGDTVGPDRGSFLSGFAKGVGAPELARDIDNYNSSQVKKGTFPFPSAVPAADAAMPKTPPPVDSPEPEEVEVTDKVKAKPTAQSTGANAFGQMANQLNVMPKTSTGGTLANTPTGITHKASPNNPNQPTATAPVATTTNVQPAANAVPNTNFGLRNIPPKQTPNYGRGQQSVQPSNVKYSGMPQKSAQTTPNRATMPVGESIDIAETLWRKMKSKR